MRLTTEVLNPYAISEKLTDGLPRRGSQPCDPAFHIAVEMTPGNEAAVPDIARSVDRDDIVIDQASIHR